MFVADITCSVLVGVILSTTTWRVRSGERAECHHPVTAAGKLKRHRDASMGKTNITTNFCGERCWTFVLTLTVKGARSSETGRLFNLSWRRSTGLETHLAQQPRPADVVVQSIKCRIYLETPHE